MTERLSQLLVEAADDLVPPAPRVGEAMARGARMRRRSRSMRSGIAVLATVAVVGGALLWSGVGERSITDDDHAGPDPAAQAYLDGGAFAVGSTVNFGVDAEHQVRLQGAVKALYYTSAGVVVRSGEEAFTDSSGPSRYALVTPDGEIRSLRIDLGDRAPDTDPAEPYLAYADRTERGWAVVAMDVRDGSTVSRTAVPGDFTWGGWVAPPVALSGTTIFVGMDDATVAVDLITGEQHAVDFMRGSKYPDVYGDRALVQPRDPSDPSSRWAVVDAFTGAAVTTLPGGDSWPVPSPDGRYAVATTYDPNTFEPTGTTAYDLQTGAGVEVDTDADPEAQTGWTPDGDLLIVTRGTASVCAAATGTCQVTSLDLSGGELKVGGRSYES